jgi:hypothetical protein
MFSNFLKFLIIIYFYTDILNCSSKSIISLSNSSSSSSSSSLNEGNNKYQKALDIIKNMRKNNIKMQKIAFDMQNILGVCSVNNNLYFLNPTQKPF